MVSMELAPLWFLLCSVLARGSYGHPYGSSAGMRSSMPESDVDLLEFPLNLEYLEAEFFLWGSLGHGLDKVAPNLTGAGPPPAGARLAKLDPLTRDVIKQFAFQEVGHLRAIKSAVKGFARPLLNLSAAAFGGVMDKAFGKPLRPSFDPYASGLNYLIASYVVPYVGLTGYVGANPKLKSPKSRKLVAGLLGVESGQDAVIRAMLYERARRKVAPYGITVAEFTDRISELRNELGSAGPKDEGLVVRRERGPEGRTAGNVLAGDKMSLAFDRTPEEILRIVYGSGNESAPGGFYPSGADGRIARAYLNK
uniref:Desiccation-related protein PCC13-62 n=1 Tax=Kalanchoe fedtschenkoi TaxID=63787 RepID=A0A7N0UBR9_KALFE